MELIYVYVKKFRNIENKEFVFSNKFDINFNIENGELNIISKKNFFNIFKYDESLCNITAIVGRNGAGKTNLLEIIGGYKRYENEIGASCEYFLLYHVEDNNFVIESINTNVLYEFVKNRKNLFCAYFEFKENKVYNFKFIDESNLNIISNLRIVNISSNKIITRKTRHNRYDTNNTKDYIFKDAHYNNIKFLFRQSAVNYDDDFLKQYLFFNRGNKEKYFKLNFHPKLELKIEKFSLKDNEKGYVVESIIKVKESVYEKLSNKEKFILNILYSINTAIAYEFIDNTEEDWENIIVDTNNYYNRLINIYLYDNYIEYYKKIYVSLIKTIMELISSRIEEINDTEYGETLQCYINDTQFESKYLNFINEIYNCLNNIDESYFLNEWSLLIYDENNIKLMHDNNLIIHISKIFSSFDEIKSVPFFGFMGKIFLNIENLSEGERALFNMISSVYYLVKSDNDINNVIFLFDEPELSLHPEWNRRFIYDLKRLISSIDEIHKYQLIITTHSPFILSDLPKENILSLYADEKGKCLLKQIKNDTFANHIHTLLSQDFFMDSTMGEYAKAKINELIRYIDNDEDIEYSKYSYYLNLTTLIGDELLRKKLLMMFEKKRKTIDDNMKKIYIEKEIERLKSELEGLNCKGDMK